MTNQDSHSFNDTISQRGFENENTNEKQEKT